MTGRKSKNKVERVKLVEPIDKSDKTKKMGTPTLEERGLSREQQDLAMMIARGIPEKVIMEAIKGLTKYKLKAYLDLDIVKGEIQKWSEVFNQESVEKWIKLDDELREEAVLELRKQIKDGKLTALQLMELWNTKMTAVSVIPILGEESIKTTETKVVEAKKTNIFDNIKRKG